MIALVGIITAIVGAVKGNKALMGVGGAMAVGDYAFTAYSNHQRLALMKTDAGRAMVEKAEAESAKSIENLEKAAQKLAKP